MIFSILCISLENPFYKCLKLVNPENEENQNHNNEWSFASDTSNVESGGGSQGSY